MTQRTTEHGREDAVRLRSWTTSGLAARLAAGPTVGPKEVVLAMPPQHDQHAQERAKERFVATLAAAYGGDDKVSTLLRQRLRSAGLAAHRPGDLTAPELLLLLEHPGVSVPVRLLAAARLGPVAPAAMRYRLYSVYRLVGGDVRLAAAVALASAGDQRVVDALIEGLEHEHADARLAAVSMLGALGAAAGPALSPLEELAGSDPERYVRRAVRRAVAVITRGVRRGPTELLAAEAPGGRGTEPEAATAPMGRGTEPEASSVPAGRGTEPEGAAAPAGNGHEPKVGDPPPVGGAADARTLSP